MTFLLSLISLLPFELSLTSSNSAISLLCPLLVIPSLQHVVEPLYVVFPSDKMRNTAAALFAVKFCPGSATALAPGVCSNYILVCLHGACSSFMFNSGHLL